MLIISTDIISEISTGGGVPLAASVMFANLAHGSSYTAHARVLDVVCSGFHDSIGLYTMCSAEEILLAKV